MMLPDGKGKPSKNITITVEKRLVKQSKSINQMDVDQVSHGNPLPSGNNRGNPHQVTCSVSSPIQMCFKILEGIDLGSILYNHAKNNRKFLIARMNPEARTISYYCSSLSSAEPLHKLGGPLNHDLGNYVLLSCCDGLSLLCCSFGLGYDLISDDYKIFATVIGTYGHRRPNKILSLKSGSWREIDNHTRGSCSSGGLAFVRGAFHWILKDDLLKYFVISFNISNEVYGEISLPEEICNICIGGYVISSVSILQGMLCAYCTCRDTEADTFKLWIMKDYGVKESWTKLFTMREAHLLFAAPRYMFVDGEVLLYYQEAGCRRCFRTSKGPYESLDSHRGLLHGFVYTESLISPKLLIKY
ncbi:F-box/kelch-repeat protein like [Capsicum annuum]